MLPPSHHRHRRPPRSRTLRFVDVGQVLARLFLGYKAIGLLEKLRGTPWAEAQRHRHHQRSARHLYEVAVRNQGLLIKTGQFLSSRPDIVPEEYIAVLSSLQDEVPPEPFEVIRRAVESELGRPLEAVYREFAPEPVASASLAQVHRAVLHDGRAVAVKVQYPGIESLVRDDLRNNEIFIALLNRLEKTLDFSFIAKEMSKQIPRELDFIAEGHSAERIAANFAAYEDIVVPDIHWEYTTRRVLTMQFIEGVKITDRDGIEALGIDPADVAKVLIVAFAHMLLEHGLFHADPHPGNLRVLPGGPPGSTLSLDGSSLTHEGGLPADGSLPLDDGSLPLEGEGWEPALSLPKSEGDFRGSARIAASPSSGHPTLAPSRAPVLVLLDFGQVKEVGPQFRLIFGQMTRALLAEDNTALGKTFRDLGFRMKRDTAEGYEGLGKAYVGDIATQMLDSEAGWADPQMFQQSYRDMLRLLRSNPLIKIPPDLLFVGRVMGLLNGLSLTLRSRTNLMLEMARLLDEQEAARANVGNPGEAKPGRLLAR